MICLLFLQSISSRQSAGFFMPVEQMKDSTVSLKQLCMRYDSTMLCVSLSLTACQGPQKKPQSQCIGNI